MYFAHCVFGPNAALSSPVSLSPPPSAITRPAGDGERAASPGHEWVFFRDASPRLFVFFIIDYAPFSLYRRFGFRLAVLSFTMRRIRFSSVRYDVSRHTTSRAALIFVIPSTRDGDNSVATIEVGRRAVKVARFAGGIYRCNIATTLVSNGRMRAPYFRNMLHLDGGPPHIL